MAAVFVAMVLVVGALRPGADAATDDAGSTACPTDFTEIGQLGGSTTAFAASDQYAYVGIGRAIRVVDIGPASNNKARVTTGITELSAVSVITLPGEASHLSVSDETLWVATGGLGEMLAYDVGDAEQPRLVGRHSFGDEIRALSVQWPMAFVGVGSRIVSVDISDPALMEVVGDAQVGQLGNYRWFELHDGRLFVPGGGLDPSGSRFVHGLRVFDVHDPSAVKDLGTAELHAKPNGVTFVGNIAYVASHDSGVRTYDMSDPLQPIPLGVVETPRGGLHRVVTDGRYAYGLGDWQSVYVADVSDPAQPVHLAIVPLPGEGPHLPAFYGDRLLLASNGAIHVMDAAEPPSLHLHAAYHTLGSSEGGIAVRHQHAYIGSVEGVRAIDVRDPSAPQPVGGVLAPFPPNNVLVSGARAYAVGGFFVCCGSVSILDTTAAASPSTLGTIDIVGNPTSVIVREPYVWVSSIESDMPAPSGWEGVRLRRYDISDPADPGEGVAIPRAGVLASVVGLTYVFDGELLRVLDTASDGTTTTVSRQPFMHSIDTTLVVGSHLYASQGDRLHVLDISDPSSPIVLDAVEGLGGHRMAVDGACLYLLRDLGLSSEVLIASLSTPASPRVIDRASGVGGMYGADGIAVESGVMYLASRFEGLTILGPRDAAVATPSATVMRPTPTPWAHTLALPLVANHATESEARRLLALPGEAESIPAGGCPCYNGVLSRTLHPTWRRASWTRDSFVTDAPLSCAL